MEFVTRILLHDRDRDTLNQRRFFLSSRTDWSLVGRLHSKTSPFAWAIPSESLVAFSSETFGHSSSMKRR